MQHLVAPALFTAQSQIPSEIQDTPITVSSYKIKSKLCNSDKQQHKITTHSTGEWGHNKKGIGQSNTESGQDHPKPWSSLPSILGGGGLLMKSDGLQKHRASLLFQHCYLQCEWPLLSWLHSILTAFFGDRLLVVPASPISQGLCVNWALPQLHAVNSHGLLARTLILSPIA